MMSAAIAILPSYASPMEDIAMGIKQVGENLWEIDVPYRKHDGTKYGTPTHLPKVRFEGNALQAAQFAAGMRDSLADESSLKIAVDCAHIIKKYRAAKGDGGNTSHWDLIEKRFAGVIVSDQLAETVTTYKAELAHLSLATFNRRMACLRAAVRWAVKKRLIDRDPLEDEWPIDTGKESKRTRILSPKEETNWFTALNTCNSYLTPICNYAFYNPVRTEDAFNTIRVRDVRLDLGEVQFYASKTGLFTRHIVWNDFTREYLNQRKLTASESDPLFAHSDGSPVGNYHKHWMTVCSKAKVSDFRFHDMRHCAASFLCNKLRWSVKDFQETGLWTSVEMLLRYAKSPIDDLKVSATKFLAAAHG